MLTYKSIFTGMAAAAVFTLSICGANAIPLLQLYGENGDGTVATNPGNTPDSWLITGSPGDTIRLWAIGNTFGPGGKGTLSEVYLIMTFIGSTPATGLSVTPTLTGSRIGGIGVGQVIIDGATFNDNGTPNAEAPYTGTAPVADNTPILMHDTGDVDGAGDPITVDTNLAPHGVFDVTGNAYSIVRIDDFTTGNDSLADFNADDGGGGIGSVVSDADVALGNGGEIHAFEFTIPDIAVFGDGFDGWHFDLVAWCDGCGNSGRWVNAPWSHDLDGAIVGQVPEPSTLALFGFGLLGIGAMTRRRKAA